MSPVRWERMGRRKRRWRKRENLRCVTGGDAGLRGYSSVKVLRVVVLGYQPGRGVLAVPPGPRCLLPVQFEHPMYDAVFVALLSPMQS